MFSFREALDRDRFGIHRREMMRIGALSAAGLTLPNVLQAERGLASGSRPADSMFGRAKNIIFLFLAGGPPQHETFDPKPLAPAEIRGPFKPISTNVPGIQFCELLPRAASIADKLAICRSLSTDDNNHDGSGYQVLTGYKYIGPNSRTIQPTDWPYLGSVIKRYRPSEVLPPLSTAWIPDLFRLNENVTPAGQTGGIMGAVWDPDRFVGDPSEPNYRAPGMRLDNLGVNDIRRRWELLARIEHPLELARRTKTLQVYDNFQQQAFDLLTSGKAQDAFAIHKEPNKLRARYGMNAWGQSVLLARRLVEAGVRLVHVQWPREPGDNAVDNPLWDTHAQNADRVEDVLCPQFDLGFTALLEDLEQRGLLDETLVVAIGEFGRTPKINRNGGRDHWGHVFSFVLAGAGISGGQVYGASDRQGGYPLDNRVSAGDFTATLFHLVGLNHEAKFRDQQGREHALTNGRPIYKLLGSEPATLDRTTSEGDVARIPPFDPQLTLLQPSFSTAASLKPLTAPSRPKGWRVHPLLVEKQVGFGIWQEEEVAFIGIRNSQPSELLIERGQAAVIAQEVRSPFAGNYKLSVRLRREAPSFAEFEEMFARNFGCRLQFFQFADTNKSAAERKELAGLDFTLNQHSDVDGYQTVSFEKEFVNPKPGANFSFGPGLGIALIVEKTSNHVIKFTSHNQVIVGLRLLDFKLEFTGKPRDENVKV